MNLFRTNARIYFSALYTPLKSQRAFGFLTFSGGIEIEHWTKMG